MYYLTVAPLKLNLLHRNRTLCGGAIPRHSRFRPAAGEDASARARLGARALGDAEVL